MVKSKKKIKSAVKTKTKAVAGDSSSVWSEVPILERDVAFREGIDGTVAIIKLSKDDLYFMLDHIAKEIWMSIDGRKSWGRIFELISQGQSVSENRIRRDFVKLIKNLNQHKLIRSK